MADNFGSCLICPITCSLFSDPVIAEDGHTYDRSAITDWIQRNGTSPLTRTSITIEGLRPNHLARNLVNEFKKLLSKHHYKFRLNVDIERSDNPFFQTTGKCFYDAKWIGYPNGPPIALLKLFGARAEKEASFYEDLTRHSHIVYTYGLVEPPQKQSTFVMLLQEKAPLGSLFNFLEHRAEKQPYKPLSNIVLNHMFIQVTDAMIFLSKKEIIHGDLACRNVLVFRIDEEEPENTIVKLTDFGISRANNIYSKIDAVETAIDTIPIRSAAPEILQNDASYSEKSDMFAMAVLMWEAFSDGRLPWGEINKESMIRQKVIKGERLSRPENCKLDRQWELILKCMSQNPADRPTFQELEKQLTELITPPINSNVSVSNCSLIDIVKLRYILEFIKYSESFNHNTTGNK
jgi:serine/threonine protein kinase